MAASRTHPTHIRTISRIRVEPGNPPGPPTVKTVCCVTPQSGVGLAAGCVADHPLRRLRPAAPATGAPPSNAPVADHCSARARIRTCCARRQFPRLAEPLSIDRQYFSDYP